MSTVEFGSLFEFIRNGMNVKQDKSGDGLPISRIETIWNSSIDPARVGYAGLAEDDCDKWLLSPGDILFSHINSVEHIGKCAIYDGVPSKLVHGMNLLCMRCKPDSLLPAFAKYLIRSDGFRAQLSNYINKAVNQASVSIGNLKGIQVTVPSIPEQRRIAVILDKADALCTKRREALVQLDRLAQSIFVEMFGDPATNPKGWPVVSMGEITERITKGESPNWQGFEYQDDGVLFVTSENVQLGELDLLKKKFIPEEFHRKLERSQLQHDDLLVNLVGASIGRSCIFKGWDGSANVNQAVGVVRTNRTEIKPAFLSAFLTSIHGQNVLLGNRVEGARANISLTDLREMQIILPPISAQEDFMQRKLAVEKICERVKTGMLNLDAFFASLQHRAFRGEL